MKQHFLCSTCKTSVWQSTEFLQTACSLWELFIWKNNTQYSSSLLAFFFDFFFLSGIFLWKIFKKSIWSAFRAVWPKDHVNWDWKIFHSVQNWILLMRCVLQLAIRQFPVCVNSFDQRTHSKLFPLSSSAARSIQAYSPSISHSFSSSCMCASFSDASEAEQPVANREKEFNKIKFQWVNYLRLLCRSYGKWKCADRQARAQSPCCYAWNRIDVTLFFSLSNKQMNASEWTSAFVLAAERVKAFLPFTIFSTACNNCWFWFCISLCL